MKKIFKDHPIIASLTTLFSLDIIVSGIIEGISLITGRPTNWNGDNNDVTDSDDGEN